MVRSALLVLAAVMLMGQAPLVDRGPFRRIEVRDGDSITLPARSGLIVGMEIRLSGIDAPETRGKCAEETAAAARATQRLRELTSRGVQIVSHLELDAYGRLLATIWDRDGRNIAAVMVAEGHARPMDGGGSRQSWCPAPP